MRGIVAGDCDRHFKTVRITGFCQQFFGLFDILGIVICQGIIIVFGERREHGSTERNAKSVEGQIDHSLFIDRIAQCLPHTNIVKRFLGIVQIQCLHQVHAALFDRKLVFFQLRCLIAGHMRHHIQRAALQSGNQGFCLLKDLEGNLVNAAAFSPVIRKALQHQIVLYRAGHEFIRAGTDRCRFLLVIICGNDIRIHQERQKLIARLTERNGQCLVIALHVSDHRKRLQLRCGIFSVLSSFNGIEDVFHFHRVSVVESYAVAKCKCIGKAVFRFLYVGSDCGDDLPVGSGFH